MSQHKNWFSHTSIDVLNAKKNAMTLNFLYHYYPKRPGFRENILTFSMYSSKIEICVQLIKFLHVIGVAQRNTTHNTTVNPCSVVTLLRSSLHLHVALCLLLGVTYNTFFCCFYFGARKASVVGSVSNRWHVSGGSMDSLLMGALSQ